MHQELVYLGIVMGVSGCGKTTVGTSLADSLGVSFHDGDDFHSEANKAKMSSGTPLNDDDREPWLQSIVDFAEIQCQSGNTLIVACSALRKKYRDHLRKLSFPVRFIHLHAPFEVIHERMKQREGHYMPESLLRSQFDTLESPAGEPGVIEVSMEQSVEDAVSQSIELPGISTED